MWQSTQTVWVLHLHKYKWVDDTYEEKETGWAEEERTSTGVTAEIQATGIDWIHRLPQEVSQIEPCAVTAPFERFPHTGVPCSPGDVLVEKPRSFLSMLPAAPGRRSRPGTGLDY